MCDVDSCGGLEPVLRRRALLNLGLAVGAVGSIPGDRVAASLAAARRLRQAADQVRPDVVVALATAALRDAANGAAVVSRLERVVGTTVRVLDGEEEARLCFLGQRAGVWTGDGPVFGIDLGGGSFEVAVGTATGIDWAASAPVGATRLQGELGASDPLTEADRGAIEARTTAAMVPVAEALSRYPGITTRTVASGGTARALARLATARTHPRSSDKATAVNQVELPAGQVCELADQLTRLDLRARLGLPGMQARRAPLLPVGAVVLATVAEELGVERFVVSEWGLREGALLDALGTR